VLARLAQDDLNARRKEVTHWPPFDSEATVTEPERFGDVDSQPRQDHSCGPWRPPGVFGQCIK
jgi:hypothetical protein